MRAVAGVAALLSIAVSCGGDGPMIPASASGQPVVGRPVVSVASPEPTAPVCPVTLPERPFAPPEPYLAEPPASYGMAWYGSAALWTMLPTDGVYLPRKSVWWSAAFGGGSSEERPEVAVVWRRLGQDMTVHRHDSPGTNAYTPEEGWFMIAGIDPPESGCWQVIASYRGATLEYVYEIP